MKFWGWVLAGLLVCTDVVGYEQMHIALVRRIAPTSNLAVLAEQMNKAQDRALQMELFLKKISHYRWGSDIQVVPFVLASDCTYDSPYYCEKDIKLMIPDMTTETFQPTWFNVWVPWTKPGICGQAHMYGAYSVTYSGCTAATNLHEHFHNLGVHHAMKNGVEYGDSTSLMGSSSRINGLNSPNYLQLKINWTKPKILFFSEEILLAPIELFPDSLHEGEFQHAILDPDGKEPIYLSMRKAIGFPYLSSGDPSRVYVHIRPDDKRKSDWVDTLVVGDYKQLTPNIKVEYLEYDNETARLVVEIDGKAVVTPALEINNSLPEIVPTLDPLHTGLWYNPDFPGQGFDIQVHGTRTLVTWYTFNSSNSAPRWYIASGSIYDAELDLYSSTGNELIEAGTIQVHFFDGVSGVVNYNTIDNGRGSIPINLLLQSDSSNLWHQPSVDLEGFSGHFYGDMFIMYWFTSGWKPFSIIGNKDVRQRWFMFMGSKTGDQYDLDIYEVTQGRFLTFDPTYLTRVGSAILHPGMYLEILRMDAERFSEPDAWLQLSPLY